MPRGKGKRKVKAKNKGKGRGKGKAPSLQDVATALARAQFAPAIKQQKDSIRDVDNHLTAGGRLDQSYDAQAGQIGAATKVATDAAAAAQQRGLDNATAAGGMVSALGTEQVARAQQQAALYGQSAKAAEEAAKTAAQGAVSLQGQGRDMAGVLGAMSGSSAQLGVSQQAALGVRRGEARTQIGGQKRNLETELQGLVLQRGAAATETATEMANQERDYALAMAGLRLDDRESKRDYRATLKTIQQRANEAAAQVELGQAELDADVADDRADNAVDRTNARTKRMEARTNRRKLDVDGDGKITRKDAKAAAKRKGGQIILAGRDGHEVRLTQEDYSKAVNSRLDIKATTAGIRRAIAGGKDDMEKVRKELGVRDRQLFEMALAIVGRGTNRHTIDRKYLPYLKSLFPGGHIPKDLAEDIDPPR